MATIVIGAQASGVGKTDLICALIAAMRERRWTAIKITQCSHQGADAKECDCDLGGAPFAISEEVEGAIPPKQSLGGASACAVTDTARFLAAGAAHSLWVRTLPGHLADAMPRIREEIARAEDVILESNSMLEFLEPDLYALIVSPCVRDFKPSARRYLDRADAILMAVPPGNHKVGAPRWLDELRERLDRIPQLAIAQPQLASAEFVAFVRDRLNSKRQESRAVS